MIIAYLGRRGNGKTLTMVKDAYTLYCNGYRVLSNMEGLTFGNHISNEEILVIDKNSDIDNVVFLIDEIQIFFDSRRSMNKKSLEFSNFIQQIRKRGCIILYTTQFANTIDKRIRDHTDIIARPKFIKNYEVCEVEYTDITSLEDIEAMGIPDSRRIVYNGYDVYNLYNTSEMVK